MYVPLDTSIHEIARLIKVMRNEGYRLGDLVVHDNTAIITFTGAKP